MADETKPQTRAEAKTAKEQNINILNKFPATTGFVDRVGIAVATTVAIKYNIDTNLIPVPIIGEFINEILVGVLIVVITWWQNRATNLQEQLIAQAPGTQIVTDDALAQSSNSTAIVSRDENKVVEK